jgi:error-prone DNA polymerase
MSGGRYWLFRARRRRPCRDRIDALVHPRRVRLSAESEPAYVELQVTTHFSFLRGASSRPRSCSRRALLELPALGIVDRNSVAGIVRAWDAEKATGVRAIIGCRLDLTDGTALLVYPTDRAAYGRMCRLLSVGKGRAGKGACHLDWSDVEEWNEG